MLNENHQDDFLYVPAQPTPEELQQFQLTLNAMPATEKLRRMFSIASTLATQLCAQPAAYLFALLQRLEDGDLEQAIKDCPCPGCQLRAEYVRTIARKIIELAGTVTDLHAELQPKAMKVREDRERKNKAREMIQCGLMAIRAAGKLGCC